MPETLPKFNRPPVVETVLSSQFARLQKFRTAHAGAFCESSLGKEWDRLEEQPRLDDYFERFGDERTWQMEGGMFRITTSMETQRTQIVGSDPTRMIQVQDSRFLYNWRKGGGGYPSYDATRKEFDRLYARFAEFIKSHSIGDIEENQWEVTYINHIVKGELWHSPEDWKLIFPWLNPLPSRFDHDALQCRWGLVLPENRGRLHVKLYYGRILPEGPDALVLDLTARGIVSADPNRSMAGGFDLGHEAIVRTFTDMTSESARAHWGRSQ
jgi:uncharacterized protein (TIGR04255 family)